MELRNDYRGRKKGIAPTTLFAAAFLLFACAADSTEEQSVALAAAGDPESTAAENTAGDTQAPGQDTKSMADTSALYTIECGQVNEAGESFCYVDRDTYIGWRTFHGFCHVCHAQDAVGSTFAPNLLDRIQDFDFEMFVERTANGYTGQVGVMPPWKDNPNVNKRYKELFAYLKARADGALPRGRPKKKP